MASPIELQMILADYAAADGATGKVHMMGAGWSVTGTPTGPQAVVLLLKIPWDRTNQPIPLRLRLIDTDGQEVRLPTPDGETPIEVRLQVEVGRPPGLPAGSMIDASTVVNIPPMPLRPGRYDWQLEVGNGEQTKVSGFTVRGS